MIKSRLAIIYYAFMHTVKQIKQELIQINYDNGFASKQMCSNRNYILILWQVINYSNKFLLFIFQFILPYLLYTNSFIC